MLSTESRIIAGILLIAVPTVEFGGLTLLAMLTRRDPGYLENPLRQGMFRAGHAHAGVWIVLALVAMLYVDRAGLSNGLAWLVRTAFAVAPILMPLGFFLSVTSPRAERPNGMIALVYAGGAVLAVGAVILGIGLLTA
jgi:heme/copper-type cytochrome/quinol oxidase subunit 4